MTTIIQYDRNTINLVFELKRSLPLDKQIDIKLSNPNLIDRVKEVYQSNTSKMSHELAKKLLEKVGVPVKNETKGLLGVFKVERTAHSYGRASQLTETTTQFRDKTKKTKIYRGQIVD